MAHIEKKAADTVLQKPIEVTIGGKQYAVPAPTLATLILVSEEVSRLPSIDRKDPVRSSLAYALNAPIFADILAIAVLGAKNLEETVETKQIVVKRLLWGLIRRKQETKVEQIVDRKAELAQHILNTLTPREMYQTLLNILGTMQLGDFFGLTTFLTEINLLRQTKVVEATQSGQ